MTKYIKKTSGLEEPFEQQKIIHSLQQVGASTKMIQDVLHEIKQQYPNIKNTQQIFNIALEKLKEFNVGVASRYNLKKALLAFGPAGYPFEQFIGALFQVQGYDVTTNVHAQGFCVEHELDVVAIKNNIHNMIECKFHNRQRYKSDLKVNLYVKARFDDMQKSWNQNPKDKHKEHKAWVITNTNFTQQAIKYALCANINLMSWKYPARNGLRDIIKKHNLHPVTALISLSRKQKKSLLKKGLVLCRDVHQNKDLLKSLGFSTRESTQLIKEAQATCAIE